MARTPWGQSDSYEVVAPGIVSYSTPSHGGYRLTPERCAVVRQLLADRGCAGFEPFAGWPWFEEDCDWCLVALAFPEHFPASAQADAEATFARHILAKRSVAAAT